MPDVLNRRFSATRLRVVVFVLHGLLVIAASRNHVFIPDEGTYVELARSIAEDGAYRLAAPSFWHAAGKPYTYFAPGWPAMLAVGYRCFGDVGMWIVLWLVWCAAAEMIFRLGRACDLGKAAAWGLVAWLTAYPHFAYYHGHLMTEAAAIAFTLANLAVGVRFVAQPTMKSCLALAVVSAAAHLTRTQTLLPLFAVWGTALVAERRPRLLIFAALFIGVHVALLAPWLWRMNSVGGGATSVELKLGSNLYNYSGVMGDGYNSGGDPVVFPPDIERMTPAERQGLLLRSAIDGIRRRPGVYLRTCLNRLGYLLAPVPNFAPSSPLKTAAFAASTVVFLYIPLAAIATAIIARRKFDRAAWVLFATLVIWYGFHTLIHASVRQRLPCDPVAATLAVVLWSNGGRNRGGETSS